MHGNKRVDEHLVEVTVHDSAPADASITPGDPHTILIDEATTDATPIGEVRYITMAPSFPDIDLSDRKKRPKCTWPGQGDDRATRSRKQNRSGRRRR